jgi:hypothetical protein
MSSDPIPPPPLPRNGHPNVAVPHFAWPFTLDRNSHGAVLEQDTDEEIVNCVELICSVPIGELADEPTFGITDPTFELQPDVNLIAAQVLEWEPRAHVAAVDNTSEEDLTLENIVLNIQTGRR